MIWHRKDKNPYDVTQLKYNLVLARNVLQNSALTKNEVDSNASGDS